MDKQFYTKKIDDLVTGDISEIVVSKDNFFDFREAWIVHPKKNQVSAEARLGGELVYKKINL